MKVKNIYIAGVGGQGVGLLAETLMRAADHAGLKIKAVDTHGLAQRGGSVISQLRIGENIYSPLIREGEADIVVALERHEALRGLNDFLRDGGTIIYYNTILQPLEVRLNLAGEISEETISGECKNRNIREIRLFKEDLEDIRMQNMVLLANINKHHLVPEISTHHFVMAMEDLMEGKTLENNLTLFQRESSDNSSNVRLGFCL